MKRYYCRKCEKFKRFAKTKDYYYCSEKVCRCCGTPLIDAKMLIEDKKERLVKKWASENEGVIQ